MSELEIKQKLYLLHDHTSATNAYDDSSRRFMFFITSKSTIDIRNYHIYSSPLHGDLGVIAAVDVLYSIFQ